MLPTMDIDVGSGAIMRIALCAVSNFQKIVNHTALRGLPLKKGNSLTALGITQFAIVTHCRGGSPPHTILSTHILKAFVS